MRVLRALLGGLVWILACVVGLVGALLSLTLVLAPVGIPLLLLARRLFKASMAFFLPRAMRHPVRELGKKGRKAGKATGQATGKATDKATDKATGRLTGKKTGLSRLWGRKRPWWERLLNSLAQPR
jgi:hypothetical protein